MELLSTAMCVCLCVCARVKVCIAYEAKQRRVTLEKGEGPGAVFHQFDIIGVARIPSGRPRQPEFG